MKVVIIGAGTCALAVADILVQDRNFKLAGFIGTAQEETKLMGKKLYAEIPFIGNHSILKELRNDNIVGFVAAIGNNYYREKAYYEAVKAGLTPVNVISRHAVIEPSVSLGKGIVVCAGCILSHGVSIADNTILRPVVVIGNNTRIGENCFLSSGCFIDGGCDIRRNVTFGVHTATLQNLQIGKNQNIAPGKIIVDSLPDIAREDFEYETTKK